MRRNLICYLFLQNMILNNNFNRLNTENVQNFHTENSGFQIEKRGTGFNKLAKFKIDENERISNNVVTVSDKFNYDTKVNKNMEIYKKHKEITNLINNSDPNDFDSQLFYEQRLKYQKTNKIQQDQQDNFLSQNRFNER